MTCKINADTTDGLKLISDTSGEVDIQSNGTTKVTIDANGNINTVGQVSTTDNGTIVTRQNVKPLIINGDMKVAQRATSLSGQTGSGYFTCDRWLTDIGTGGTWTISQVADVPTGSGFRNSMKYDCTTANGSLSAGSFMTHQMRFEGQDLQLFKKGTPNAEAFTVSFWVKSAKTGTYIVELEDQDNTRSVSQAYTISSANTWEKKVLSFPADTTGVFDNNNSASLHMFFWLLAGTTYSSGTLNTTWSSQTQANRAVGVVNLADSTSNDWYITGVQMEVGEFDATTVPAFQHESFGENFHRCQRYLQKYLQPPLVGVANATQTVARASMSLQARMRTNPTASQVNGNFVWFNTNGHQPQSSGFSATYTDEDTFECDVTMTVTGNTVPSICKVYQSGNAYLLLNAEL